MGAGNSTIPNTTSKNPSSGRQSRLAAALKVFRESKDTSKKVASDIVESTSDSGGVIKSTTDDLQCEPPIPSTSKCLGTAVPEQSNFATDCPVGKSDSNSDTISDNESSPLSTPGYSSASYSSESDTLTSDSELVSPVENLIATKEDSKPVVEEEKPLISKKQADDHWRLSAYKSKMKLFGIFLVSNVVFLVVMQLAPSIVVQMFFFILLLLTLLEFF